MFYEFQTFLNCAHVHKPDSHPVCAQDADTSLICCLHVNNPAPPAKEKVPLPFSVSDWQGQPTTPDQPFMQTY